MSQTNSFEEALAFPFRGKTGQNRFLIGALVALSSSMIPILPLILIAGYCAQIMRRVIREDGRPEMPAWEAWDRLLLDGLKLTAVGLILSLPLMLVAFGGWGLYMLSTVPMMMLGENTDPDSALFFAPMFLGMIAMFVSAGLSMVLSVALGLFMPPALAHVVAQDSFGAAFRVREWWRVFRANLSGFLLSTVILFGLWMVFMFLVQILYVTVCLCCLIPVIMGPAGFYLALVGYTLYAQAYRTGLERLPAPGQP